MEAFSPIAVIQYERISLELAVMVLNLLWSVGACCPVVHSQLGLEVMGESGYTPKRL